MKTTKNTINRQEHGGSVILGEAVNLLRTAPPRIVITYLAGGIPFVLGLLYFWSDMSRSAFAGQRCLAASLGMAALFIWMKCWQSVFTSELRANLSHLPREDWTLRRVAWLISIQTFFQPLGLILIPLALLAMLPFYSIYTFFQNITIMGNGEHRTEIRPLVARAWKHALLWPKQNHILLWLACPWSLGLGMLTAFGIAWMTFRMTPELLINQGDLWFAIGALVMFQLILPLAPFACVVAGNIAILVAFLPDILYGLFGVETLFTLSGVHSIMNTTFLMTVFAISYLFLDPVMKASYVLRCFHGESLGTGEDLLLELGGERSEVRDQRSQ